MYIKCWRFFFKNIILFITNLVLNSVATVDLDVSTSIADVYSLIECLQVKNNSINTNAYILYVY